MKHFSKIIILMAAIFIPLIFNITLAQNHPQFEYSIKELEYSKEQEGLPKESLTVETKNNSVEINQVIYWGGSYKPHLEKEGNIIKIIFMKETICSLLEAFNFKAIIRNLTPGKYKLQFLYQNEECLYEGSRQWEECSKLDKRNLVKARQVFIKTNESEIEIK